MLLAEDNLPDALLIREAIRIENLPVHVHAVVDGEEAIAFISRAASDPASPHPDLVILDLNLPKSDGFDVLRYLRGSQRFGGMPVLVVSSSNAPGDRQLAGELGAGYFRKTPSYSDFLKLGAAIRELLPRKGDA